MDDVLLDDLVVDLAGNDAWKTEPRDHEGKWTNKLDTHLILQGGAVDAGLSSDFGLQAPLSSDESWALHEVYGYAWGYKLLNPYLHHHKQVFVGGAGGHYEDATPKQAVTADKAIAALDTAFEKAKPLDHAVKVWRRSGADEFGEGNLTGKDITNLAYTSTATELAVHGYGYESKPVLWEIRLPAGTKALPGNDFENEILLNRGGVFHITHDEDLGDGQRHVIMTYQPHKDPSDVAAEDKIEVTPEAKPEDPLADLLAPPPTPVTVHPWPGHTVETWGELDTYPEGTHVLVDDYDSLGAADEYVKLKHGVWGYLMPKSGKVTGVYTASEHFGQAVDRGAVKVVPGDPPAVSLMDALAAYNPKDFMGMAVLAQDAPVGSFFQPPDNESGDKAYTKIDAEWWQLGEDNYKVDNHQIDAFKQYVANHPETFPGVRISTPPPVEQDSPYITAHAETFREIPGTTDNPDWPLLDFEKTQHNFEGNPYDDPYTVLGHQAVLRLSNYPTDWAISVNDELRHGTESATLVDQLDQAFRPTLKPAMLLRKEGIEAVGLKPAQVHSAQAKYDALKALVGKTLVDKGYMSTSYDEKGSTVAGSPTFMLRIHAPAGTPAAFAQPFSEFTEEHEVVLKRGLPMEVTGVTWNKTSYGSNMFVLDLLAHPEKMQSKPPKDPDALPLKARSVKTLEALPVGTTLWHKDHGEYRKDVNGTWQAETLEGGSSDAPELADSSSGLAKRGITWHVLPPEPKSHEADFFQGTSGDPMAKMLANQTLAVAPIGSTWHTAFGPAVKQTSTLWKYPSGELGPLPPGVDFFQGTLEQTSPTLATATDLLNDISIGGTVVVLGVMWKKTASAVGILWLRVDDKPGSYSTAELAKQIAGFHRAGDSLD